MIKRLEISLLVLLIITGCGSTPPPLPTIDPCLALHTIGDPRCQPPTSLPGPVEGRMTKIQKEVTYRLQAIRVLIGQEPMTNMVFHVVTSSISEHRVSLYYELSDQELQNLLDELEQIAPTNDQSYIDNIRVRLEKFEKLGPKAPFSEVELADPGKISAARDLFEQIEADWQHFLESQ